MNGVLAPQGINVVVIIVILTVSCRFSIVREAMIPGTPQPVPISIGIKDFPERPNLTENSIHDKCYTCHVSTCF